MIAESLRALSTYLEANAAQYAGLENSVPIVTEAAHRFAARDYTEAFNLIWHAYRTIETIGPATPGSRRCGRLRASGLNRQFTKN